MAKAIGRNATLTINGVQIPVREWVMGCKGTWNMTEHDWLTSTDPAAMLRYLMTGRPEAESMGANYPMLPCPINPSDRKLRLFACACCRAFGVEIFAAAEEEISSQGEDTAGWATAWCRQKSNHGNGGLWDYKTATHLPDVRPALLREIFGNPWKPVNFARRIPCSNCHGCGRVSGTPGAKVMVLTRRCQFCKGKGYHECTLNPPWLTPTVQALAQSAYDSADERGHLDAGTLAVLSNALEEAGCTSEALLRHLRGHERCWLCLRVGSQGTEPGRCSVCGTGTYLHHGYATGWAPLRGPHIAGCWALDLLLGKE